MLTCNHYANCHFLPINVWSLSSGEVLNSLDAEDAKKVVWVLKLVEDLPRIPAQYLKKLVNTDDIWEVRVQSGKNVFRLLGFFNGSDLIVIDHAFQKKTQKIPLSAIRTAEKRKSDYFKRREAK